MSSYYNNPPYSQFSQAQAQAPPAELPLPTRNESVEMGPRLGATFVPGGFDDYYMPPEVLAPSPQRLMHEVPENMQNDLQRMELEASSSFHASGETDTTSPTSIYSQPSARPERETSLAHALGSTVHPVNNAQQQNPAPGPEPPFKAVADTSFDPHNAMGPGDLPSFSPFPKIKGDGVPRSDEAKEEVLWTSRDSVLHSNDVSLQLAWAKDALTWVEIAMEATARELNGRPRPATPKVEHVMRIDALTIINYLAGQDHPEALFLRSKWLEFGKFGYRPDKREAYNGYYRAAELGFGRAEYRMGMLHEASNEMRKAIEHYEKGLKLQDSAASYRLGMMCLLGQHGQIKDYQHGLDLISAAAETSDEDAPQGAYVYGMLIARELPDAIVPEGLLPSRLDLARKYIEKAAFLGFAKAQLKMGQAYELCQLGCDFNPSFSIHYYGLAAKQGQPEAALGVSRWFLFGYEGFFNKNEQLAYKFAQDAAAAKLPTGEFAMGYYHEIGIHVQKDLREARRWYELAAEHGNKDAAGRLQSLDEEKTLTKQDHETTTLGRIKSQHGSMRGKRPERLRQQQALPTLDEGAGDGGKPPRTSPGVSPRISPRPSPNVPSVRDNNLPDPSRLSISGPASGGHRPPAFTIATGPVAETAPAATGRPKSTAPYPEDDHPAHLRPNRPVSTAPYPEDDMRPPLSPHFNPGIRASHGPQADRPMSAFGIRPLSPSGAAGGHQPSPNRLSVQPPNDGRNRMSGGGGWEPQIPAGYRQPSPGPRQGDYRRNDYRPDMNRPATAQPLDQRPQGGPPPQSQAPNRLQKPNPQGQGMSSIPPNQGPGPRDSGYGQGGRDYGQRVPLRPVSSQYPPMGSGPGPRPVSENYGRGGGGGGPMPSQGGPLPSQGGPLPSYGGSGGQGGAPGPGGPRPAQLKDRPMHMDPSGPGRVGSAPPTQGRPQAGRPPLPQSSSAASAPAAAARPQASGKAPGQGPATFEEMGIAQGKQDSDCVVM